MDCMTCIHGRRACNEDYVACAHWERVRQESSSENITTLIMDLLGLQTLATGWAYLGRYPEQEKSPDTIASCNMMTNHVICFPKGFHCNKYFQRDNIS